MLHLLLGALASIAVSTSRISSSCQTSYLTANETSKDPISISISPLDHFEASKVSGLNAKAREGKYSNSISNLGSSSAIIAFHRDLTLLRIRGRQLCLSFLRCLGKCNIIQQQEPLDGLTIEGCDDKVTASGRAPIA